MVSVGGWEEKPDCVSPPRHDPTFTTVGE